MNGFEIEYYIVVALSYVLIRPLATILHELGHFLMLSAFVKKAKIRIFIGSYGVGKAAFNLKLGRATWSLHPYAFLMRGSICDYDQALSAKQLLLVTLMGPLFSLLAGIGIGMLVFFDFAEGPLQLLFLLTGLLFLVDGLHSLLYRYDFIPLGNQRITANDGQLLEWLFRFRSQTDAYLHATWLFEHNFYEEAWDQFELVLKSGRAIKEVYENQAYCALYLGKYAEGFEIYDAAKQRFPLEPHDYLQLAKLHEATGEYGKAMLSIRHGLENAPGNSMCLNEKGVLFIIKGDLKAAKSELDKALIAEPEFSLARTNRAWLHIQAKNWEAAKKDLDAAAKEDFENVYLQRNWALYFWGIGEVEKALSTLETAKLLGLQVEEYQNLKEKIGLNLPI